MFPLLGLVSDIEIEMSAIALVFYFGTHILQD